ncbi:hypothetical protein [Gottfriedia acidiceleris]|uniref:hypothetical protein n=1 Tax=Gottfriedia acidiceleris TaxID=371036 RepID=UPI002FFE3444
MLDKELTMFKSVILEAIKILDQGIKYTNENYGNLLGAFIGAFATIWVLRRTIKKQDEILLKTFIEQKKIEQDTFLQTNRPLLHSPTGQIATSSEITLIRKFDHYFDFIFENQKVFIPFNWSIHYMNRSQTKLNFSNYTNLPSNYIPEEFFDIRFREKSFGIYEEDILEPPKYRPKLYFIKFCNLSNVPAINVSLQVDFEDKRFPIIKTHLGFIPPGDTIHILLGEMSQTISKFNATVHYESLVKEKLSYRFSSNVNLSDAFNLPNNGPVHYGHTLSLIKNNKEEIVLEPKDNYKNENII